MIILDTHIFIWAILQPDKIPGKILPECPLDKSTAL